MVTELSQHEADGGEFQEREDSAVEIFPVLGEATTTIEPSDRAFNQRLYNVAKNRSFWSVILVPLEHLVTERGR
jgi:hypothetical protein